MNSRFWKSAKLFLPVILIVSGLLFYDYWSDTTEFISYQDLKVGQSGYGLTVFQGRTVERFKVTFDGTTQHFLFPKEKVILVRMGEPLIGSSVLAGMSGSPVYFKHRGGKLKILSRWKLAGALAFGFDLPSSEKSLGGVTPIQAMLHQERTLGLVPLFKQEKLRDLEIEYFRLNAELARAPENKRREIEKLLNKRKRELIAALSEPTKIGEYNGHAVRLLQPILTIAAKSKNQDTLAAQKPMAVPKPGEAVSMLLAKGDFDLSVTCTVTYATKDRFWACGHPILGDGPIQAPVYKTSIATSYKGPMDAFKIIDSQHEPAGFIYFDGTFAIEGKIENLPPEAMIPVKLRLAIRGKKPIEIRYRVFRNKIYSEAIIELVAKMALDKLWNAKQEATTRSTAVIHYDNSKITLYDVAASGSVTRFGPFIVTSSPWSIVNKTARLAGQLISSEWKFKVKNITMAIDLELGDKILYLDSYRVLNKNNQATDRATLGEEIKLVLGLRNNEGTKQFVTVVPLKIPERIDIKNELRNFPALPILISVESGNNFRERDERRMLNHQPDNKEEFLRQLLLNQRNPQKLYIQVIFPPSEEVTKSTPTITPEATNGWALVPNLNFLRSTKTYERLVIARKIDTPREDYILNVQLGFNLQLVINPNAVLPVIPQFIPGFPINDEEEDE